MSTYRPDQILKAVRADLRTWAAAAGGDVVAAGNVWDFVERLRERPGSFRITLHWKGHEPAQPGARTGHVMREELLLVCSGDLGLAVDRGGELFDPKHRDAAFLATLDSIRQRVMAYRFGFLSAPNDRFAYGGTSDRVQMPDDATTVAAYAMTFFLFLPVAMPATPVTLTLT